MVYLAPKWGGGGGERDSCSGLYGEAPPKRGTLYSGKRREGTGACYRYVLLTLNKLLYFTLSIFRKIPSLKLFNIWVSCKTQCMGTSPRILETLQSFISHIFTSACIRPKVQALKDHSSTGWELQTTKNSSQSEEPSTCCAVVKSAIGDREALRDHVRQTSGKNPCSL